MSNISKLTQKLLRDTVRDIFDEVYAKWGGDKRVDDDIVRDLLVPVITGSRLKKITRQVNMLMNRQEDLPLDNIWRVELRDNDKIKLTDFTMPSSGSTIVKTIPITEAPTFIRDGLAVLQISPDAGQVDGVGKRISDTVYYIVERVDGGNTREEGERCS